MLASQHFSSNNKNVSNIACVVVTITNNGVVAICVEDQSKFEVSPGLGTVGFGSGLHNWAFTLDTFANFYAKKSGLPKARYVFIPSFWCVCVPLVTVTDLRHLVAVSHINM